MSIALEDIKRLREKTGAGMADCKKALEEADGNMEEAIEVLRKKGAATAAKRADKAAEEGVVGVAVADDNSAAAIVEVNCETDFVARNEEFSSFVDKLARKILDENPAGEDAMKALEIDGVSVESQLNELLAKFSEKIGIRRFERIESPEGFIAGYVHGGSRLAVLVELADVEGGEGDLKQIARDIAMQVAAMNPMKVSRSEFSDAEVEKEREIYRDQLKDDKKPADIIDKIVNGKIDKFFQENTLLEQSFVKDSSKSVADVLGEFKKGATVKRFVRFNLGEELESATSA
jgi:elongation factor Ts